MRSSARSRHPREGRIPARIMIGLCLLCLTMAGAFAGEVGVGAAAAADRELAANCGSGESHGSRVER